MLGRKKEGPPVDILATKGGLERSMDEQMATVLSSDTKFKGSLSFERSLKIEGEFEGEITSSGILYVGKDAKIKAEIKVGSIYIDGAVTGNVTASDKVELRSASKLLGDIKASRLVVEEGAIFVGHCEVGAKSSDKDTSSKGAMASGVKSPLETVVKP
jgi:cytoskeletal protein CcmA (bactofilin family)